MLKKIFLNHWNKYIEKLFLNYYILLQYNKIIITYFYH
jgi:hypothetical protein